MLEFCLDDGAKLFVVNNKTTAAETKVLDNNQNSIETMFFDASKEVPKTLKVNNPATVEQPSAGATEPVSLKRKTIEKGYRALEVGTVTLALAHNWWQWVYVDHQNYGSIANFLTSAEFLIWLLLLFAGVALGLLTLKFSRKKELAYVGLLILAINFLLLLVPRR